MKALLDLFKQVTQEEEFDAIRIGLASPEKIRSWSYGEVKARTTTTALQAERDGLSAPRSSGRSRTTSACAASTSASSTAA